MNPREHEDGERRKDCPEEGRARHTKGDCRRPNEDRECCADGCARGNAEDERLRKRILHTRLHDDTRKRQSCPCRHCEQDARHTQRPYNVRERRINGGDAPRELCRDDGERIGERHGDTACRYCTDSCEDEKYGEREGRGE